MIIMMEKLDALAIRFFNWGIITSISIILMIIALGIGGLTQDKKLMNVTYKEVRESVEEWAGIKKND